MLYKIWDPTTIVFSREEEVEAMEEEGNKMVLDLIIINQVIP